MAITFEDAKRIGYGYVEPNFLSAPRTGQVRAEWPAAEGIDVLMNGQFVRRKFSETDQSPKGEVAFDGEGAWWMVFNEEKLYDERYQMHRDYAMKREDFYDGIMVPRVLVPILGDTFTTNTILDGETLEVGDKCGIDEATGMIKKDDEGFMAVVKCYTMPCGQPGVKLEVIANQ